MKQVSSMETAFQNFFSNVKAIGSEFRADEAEGRLWPQGHSFAAEEETLLESFGQQQVVVHNAMCDSINTPVVMQALQELIVKTNIYLSGGRSKINMDVLEMIARYITRIFKVFGLADTGADIGFGANASSSTSIENAEDLIMPYVRTLSRFRDAVRDLARSDKPPKDLLMLCDKLRDVELPELGVLMDDQDDGRALVKLVGKQEIERIKEEKRKREEEKHTKKAGQLAELERKRMEKLEKGKMSAEAMFRSPMHAASYSAFDEQGVPTHDATGAELSKSRRKKLQKEWEVQKKLHAEYLASVKE